MRNEILKGILNEYGLTELNYMGTLRCSFNSGAERLLVCHQRFTLDKHIC